jgi:hypothetical protein
MGTWRSLLVDLLYSIVLGYPVKFSPHEVGILTECATLCQERTHRNSIEESTNINVETHVMPRGARQIAG